MALQSGRRLWLVATLSLLLWAVIFLLGLSLLPTTGASFNYLYIGIAEPLITILVFAVPEGSINGALAILVAVVVQLAGYLAEFALRTAFVTRPFVVGELLDIVFIVLSFFRCLVWVWFAVAALRNYTAENGRAQYDQSVAGAPGPAATSSDTTGAAATAPPDATTVFNKSIYSFDAHPRPTASLYIDK